MEFNNPEIKEHLAQIYENEIEERRNRYLNERKKSIEEEQKRLADLKAQMRSERLAKETKTYNQKRQEYEDYQKILELRNLKNFQYFSEKQRPQNVSLNLNVEKNLQNYQNKIMRLSNLSDLRSNSLQNYSEAHPKPRNYLDKPKIIYDKQYLSPLVARSQYSTDILGMYPQKKPPSVYYDDKYSNPDYKDYLDKNKEYQYYNINTTDNYNQMTNDMKLSGEHDEIIANKNEVNKINQMVNEGRILEKEKKKEYKNILDEQLRDQVLYKLKDENYTLDQANIKPQYQFETFSVNNRNMLSPNQNFINKNNFVQVNPCKNIYLFSR